MTQTVFSIDWNLPEDKFEESIRSLIDQSFQSETVIPLPIYPGNIDVYSLVALIVSSINCDKCDSICCKKGVDDKPIDVLEPELKRLAKYGCTGKVNFPCRFLVNNKCEIYSDRPLVCVLYPFDPQALDASGQPLFGLCSSCPESRQLALRYYKYIRLIRRRFLDLGSEFIEEILHK